MSLPSTWLKACQRVKDGHADALVLTVYAFVNEPELLRDALLYAYENGVAVTFAPLIEPTDLTPEERINRFRATGDLPRTSPVPPEVK